MTKKEYCTKNPVIAYYSGLNGIEFHGIEYDIEEYAYAVSGAWGGQRGKQYHRVKVKYDRFSEPFVVIRGYKIPLSDCITV